MSVIVLCFLVCPVVTLSTQISAPKTDEFLGPIECLDRNLTRESCDLVFCSPWQYCVNGRCTCKPAYLCPREGVASVCSRDNKQLLSYCQAMAVSCQTNRPVMSHFGQTCSAGQPTSRGSVEAGSEVVRLFVPGAGNAGNAGNAGGEEFLVCQQLWNMAAANVACREAGHPLGAASFGTVSYISLLNYHDEQELPARCVSVRCQGYENSLAECVIYDRTIIGNKDVATATCVQPSTDECSHDQFSCVNRKCVSIGQTCDGVDDCGDRSDEMCCKKCRGGAFRCSSGVCLHEESVGDGQMDCLDGEDESKQHTKPLPVVTNTEFISPKTETRVTREHLESRLNCGIPQTISVDEEVRGRGGGRFKRVVGGWPARPTQIQWQVAVYYNQRNQCGGAFIGGCWVITAAHCLGTNPSLSITKDGVPGQDRNAYQKPNLAKLVVRFSLWSRILPQSTTDIVPVKDVHIHPKYNPDTRENDIALVQLETFPFNDKCLLDNEAVSAICVPWTTRLFNPNHTCSISGWGLTESGRRSRVLQWANVSLIEDCQRFHNDSIKPGMICAGDLTGSVDACDGDDGGPLVCKDQLGVSYLWGIISWGRGCGRPRSPGVYTQVAHYFEWIRLQTGWNAVTKFNGQ